MPVNVLSATFSRVYYCREAPTWLETASLDAPVFLAPPRIRPALRRALLRAAANPRFIAASVAARADLKSLLRFLVWKDTVRCFAIEELLNRGDEIVEAFGTRLWKPHRTRERNRRLPTVTALVLARNEERQLGAALHSVAPIADKILVVDDESTDGTVRVARAANARVITRALCGDFAAQRNAALDQIDSEWVLQVDADEVLEPALVPVLKHVLSWGRADGVYVPRLNRIIGRGEEPVMWPDLQLRLFRSSLRYSGPIHEQVGNWHTAVFLPLSGPYLIHEKDELRQHRSTLFYDTIDSSPYPRDFIASVRAELSRRERDQRSSE
jgi:Glycosyl transferase family 2